MVKDNRVLLEGRAQYITLQLPDNDYIMIINVYAAKSSNDKAPMWKKLGEANFTSRHLILRGDFNHLEEIHRRGIAEERQMHRKEAVAWHHMILQYGLLDAWKLDSFHKMSKKEYTFDNG